jgi:hypothetical protein
MTKINFYLNNKDFFNNVDVDAYLSNVSSKSIGISLSHDSKIKLSKWV